MANIVMADIAMAYIVMANVLNDAQILFTGIASLLRSTFGFSKWCHQSLKDFGTMKMYLFVAHYIVMAYIVMASRSGATSR